ncbi:MAG TPA: ACP S-malonyltransferase [Steroidobacteraceae bacterium]|nr:ACP S-malonyltransferase [Steroidobacteraceae bacterium]
MTLAIVFPGQGSQSVGMLSALAEHSPLVRSTFGEASEVLGYDLWQRCQDGPAEALNSTECTQPAMLAAGVATYRVWRAQGGAVPERMAGHSLGEFSALVAAGCLDFKTAVDVVRERARAMQAAVPVGAGAMAAILGLEDAQVEAACRDAAAGEVVEAVNFNAPGQVVIAGNAGAVARAIESATARGAKRAIALPVSVPAHSSLMMPAAEALRARLESARLDAPSAIAVYGVDVRIHTEPVAMRAALVRQLHTPVRWAATVRAMLDAGATTLIECGPGKVLTSLNRRIDKNRDLKMLAVEDPASLEAALAAAGS